MKGLSGLALSRTRVSATFNQAASGFAAARNGAQ